MFLPLLKGNVRSQSMRGKALSRGFLPCGRPIQTHDTSRHKSTRTEPVLYVGYLCLSYTTSRSSISGSMFLFLQTCELFNQRDPWGRGGTPIHSIHRPPHHQPPQAPSSSSDLSEERRRTPRPKTAPRLSTGNHFRSPHKRIRTQPPTHQAPGRCPRTSPQRR